MPVSWFDHDDEDQARLCWNYQNLRPLMKEDNQEAGSDGFNVHESLLKLEQTEVVSALLLML